MKTKTSRSITLLAASALIATAGLSTMATAEAGSRHGRSNGIYSEVRALDTMTDRLHSMAKRYLPRNRDSKRLMAKICELEDRADRLRSGVENRVASSVVSRLVASVEASAQTVARGLRHRPSNCEISRLATSTLYKARSLENSFACSHDSRIDHRRTNQRIAPYRPIMSQRIPQWATTERHYNRRR